jgi:hypothetical protein
MKESQLWHFQYFSIHHRKKFWIPLCTIWTGNFINLVTLIFLLAYSHNEQYNAWLIAIAPKALLNQSRILVGQILAVHTFYKVNTKWIRFIIKRKKKNNFILGSSFRLIIAMNVDFFFFRCCDSCFRYYFVILIFLLKIWYNAKAKKWTWSCALKHIKF